MKFRLTIKLDNAAFESKAGAEVGRILEQLAGKLDGSDLSNHDCWRLHDINGNAVGEAKVTSD